MKSSRIKRRSFLHGVTTVSALATFPIAISGCQTTPTMSAGNTDILYWVSINSDNTVTFKIPQPEIGQAATTTVSQLLAEELEADWDSVRTEFYDPNTNLDNANVYVWTPTLASLSANHLFDPARTAGAQIRAMLISAAASSFDCNQDELFASRNFVHHKSDGRKLTYAELALAASAMQPPGAGQLELKTQEDWKLIGKSIDRLDLKQSTHAGIKYGIDVEVPNMRHAAIRQCPVYGGRLIKVDDSVLNGFPGAPKVITLKGGHAGYNSPVPEGEDPDLWATPVTTSDAVAVVADTWWQAKRALDALEPQWDEGEFKHTSSDSLRASLSDKLTKPLDLSISRGDVATAKKSAAQVHQAEYYYPFMDPAPLEPLNCTAVVNENSAEIWAGTQYADEAIEVASKLTGLPRQQIEFHIMHSGGGFGRRAENDFVYQAVQIAMAISGTPVKLLWTREECIRKSFCAPLTLVKYEGAIDAQGEVSAWVCRAASGQAGDQAYGATEFPFHFPNSLIEYDRSTPSPIPFGWMRGVGYTQHLWMNFGFLDELARLAGGDPAHMYRSLLHESKIPLGIESREIAVQRVNTLRRVLDATLELTSWDTHKSAEKSGRGIAVSDTEYYPGYGSTSAKSAVVDVSLTEEHGLSINKVFIVIDCGTVINPDIVVNQLEGGVAYALTNALYSEIVVEQGRVEQSNFHDYPILKAHEMPEVQIEILPGTGKPLSVGEDALPITIAALVNAIADAGGPRIRSLPIKLKQA